MWLCRKILRHSLFLRLSKGGESNVHRIYALTHLNRNDYQYACHLGMPPRLLGWHDQEA